MTTAERGTRQVDVGVWSGVSETPSLAWHAQHAAAVCTLKSKVRGGASMPPSSPPAPSTSSRRKRKVRREMEGFLRGGLRPTLSTPHNSHTRLITR
jgi:hypothetical protein